MSTHEEDIYSKARTEASRLLQASKGICRRAFIELVGDPELFDLKIRLDGHGKQCGIIYGKVEC